MKNNKKSICQSSRIFINTALFILIAVLPFRPKVDLLNLCFIPGTSYTTRGNDQQTNDYMFTSFSNTAFFFRNTISSLPKLTFAQSQSDTLQGKILELTGQQDSRKGAPYPPLIHPLCHHALTFPSPRRSPFLQDRQRA